jgi:hypothetical protein|tara:strand:- start:1035 stop:1202 length:168 start_codon:yes stop_codon:yes gene_type:complete
MKKYWPEVLAGRLTPEQYGKLIRQGLAHSDKYDAEGNETVRYLINNFGGKETSDV